MQEIGGDGLTEDVRKKLNNFLDWLDENYETKNGVTALYWGLAPFIANSIKHKKANYSAQETSEFHVDETRLKSMTEQERIDILDPICYAVHGKINLDGMEIMANRLFAIAVLDFYKEWQKQMYEENKYE